MSELNGKETYQGEGNGEGYFAVQLSDNEHIECSVRKLTPTRVNFVFSLTIGPLPTCNRIKYHVAHVIEIGEPFLEYNTHERLSTLVFGILHAIEGALIGNPVSNDLFVRLVTETFFHMFSVIVFPMPSEQTQCVVDKFGYQKFKVQINPFMVVRLSMPQSSINNVKHGYTNEYRLGIEFVDKAERVTTILDGIMIPSASHWSCAITRINFYLLRNYMKKYKLGKVEAMKKLMSDFNSGIDLTLLVTSLTKKALQHPFIKPYVIEGTLP